VFTVVTTEVAAIKRLLMTQAGHSRAFVIQRLISGFISGLGTAWDRSFIIQYARENSWIAG